MYIKNIFKLNPNSNGPVLGPSNPILPQQPLVKYVKDRTQFRLEIKSCLTQWENLKHILKLNPNSDGAYFRPFNPTLPQQPLDKYEEASINFWSQNKSYLTHWVNLKTFFNLALIVMSPI